jgi:hybrid cluster-associated redox disulfide protein
MFHPAMTVNEVLARHPAARWVFAAYHLNDCVRCPTALNETLTELAQSYGLSLDRFVADLNQLSALPTSQRPNIPTS